MLSPLTAPATDELNDLCRQAQEEAQGLMASGRLLCAPAVVSVLNARLGGGLAPEMILRLTATLTQGMGGAGCACGALTGAQMALGLFLGGPEGLAPRRLAAASRTLHDQFRAAHGATCCRALTKKAQSNGLGRKRLCAELTGLGAGLACRLILEAKPELLEGASPAPAPAAAPRRRLLGVLKGQSA